MTTAPAPSANKIAVERSFQSTILDIVSLPTTNILLKCPFSIYCCAVVSAKTNPAHTAWRSNAGQEAPSRSCSIVAVAGKILSGVVVARIIRSISEALIPAISRAFLLASKAKSQVLSSVTILLSLIPVLEVIHSSEVSRVCSRSLLVITLDGK